MSNATNTLPQSLPPRGLQREQAAAYVGVGCSKFDQMVDDGRMPKPKRIDTRKVWDRFQLDLAFEELDGGTNSVDANEWDEVL
ncbi:MAG: hypothetical protein HOA08_10705 [Rhodospirillaceae bacterium]|jgi:predicted DNA-binding transcriptional regulator AlpA|nr:hypothetical protein [Rhodospirillaceae bacterium]MBT3492827.1 hypothetical protein [Rhodospirillaceae bacterium]MBT3779994.1 hypothetical protein [Rhodospirillaceae bacterium]MBT3976678.1 hypothetical protein [Rhodospirillaceae bacterium]MBT4168432.1 hypothetical protein [Rhodospirillaceae bacterium]